MHAYCRRMRNAEEHKGEKENSLETNTGTHWAVTEQGCDHRQSSSCTQCFGKHDAMPALWPDATEGLLPVRGSEAPLPAGSRRRKPETSLLPSDGCWTPRGLKAKLWKLTRPGVELLSQVLALSLIPSVLFPGPCPKGSSHFCPSPRNICWS